MQEQRTISQVTVQKEPQRAKTGEQRKQVEGMNVLDTSWLLCDSFFFLQEKTLDKREAMKKELGKLKRVSERKLFFCRSLCWHTDLTPI